MYISVGIHLYIKMQFQKIDKMMKCVWWVGDGWLKVDSPACRADKTFINQHSFDFHMKED